MRKSSRVKIRGEWYRVVSVWSRARADEASRSNLKAYGIARLSEWLVDDSKGRRWFGTVDRGQPLTLQWETVKYSRSEVEGVPRSGRVDFH